METFKILKRARIARGFAFQKSVDCNAGLRSFMKMVFMKYHHSPAQIDAKFVCRHVQCETLHLVNPSTHWALWWSKCMIEESILVSYKYNNEMSANWNLMKSTVSLTSVCSFQYTMRLLTQCGPCFCFNCWEDRAIVCFLGSCIYVWTLRLFKYVP